MAMQPDFNTQASAIWAGVAFFRSAMVPSRSTRAWFAFRASGVKRGRVLRKSVLSNFVSEYLVGAVQGVIIIIAMLVQRSLARRS